MIQLSHIWVFIQELKLISQRDISTLRFAAFFSIANIWKQPKCPSVNEWMQKCGTHTQWNTSHPLEGILRYSIYNNIDEP